MEDLILDDEFANVNSFEGLRGITEQVSLNKYQSIYSFIFMVLILTLLFNTKKQGVHDLYAKTYCVYE